MLLALGKPRMGLFTWLSFETYWRPSEGLSVLCEHVIPGIACSSGTLQFLSFVLRPLELGVPTKTQIYDASVVLDLPRHQFLAPCVLALKNAGTPLSRPFPFSLVEFRRAFQQAAVAAGLSPLKACPYSLRHGGASHDQRLGCRTLNSIQARGMWKSPTSVARYQKHSLLARQFQRLPKHVQRQVLSKAAAGQASFAERFWQLWRSPASRAGL